MIAGTYTPFTVGVLSGGRALGPTAGVWSAALTGVIMKLWYPRRLEGMSTALYLALGWLGLLVVPSLFGSLAHSATILIVIGGILYSIGAGFQLWRALPFQNAIWHAFVVLAAGSHYAAILQGVVTTWQPAVIPSYQSGKMPRSTIMLMIAARTSRKQIAQNILPGAITWHTGCGPCAGPEG